MNISVDDDLYISLENNICWWKSRHCWWCTFFNLKAGRDKIVLVHQAFLIVTCFNLLSKVLSMQFLNVTFSHVPPIERLDSHFSFCVLSLLSDVRSQISPLTFIRWCPPTTLTRGWKHCLPKNGNHIRTSGCPEHLDRPLDFPCLRPRRPPRPLGWCPGSPGGTSRTCKPTSHTHKRWNQRFFEMHKVKSQMFHYSFSRIWF